MKTSHNINSEQLSQGLPGQLPASRNTPLCPAPRPRLAGASRAKSLHSAAMCRIVWLAYTYAVLSPQVAAICPVVSAVRGENLPTTPHTLQAHKTGSSMHFQHSSPNYSPRVHAHKTHHQPCFQVSPNLSYLLSFCPP